MKFSLQKIRNDDKINKNIIKVMIVLYIILLIWVIVFKCNYNEGLHIERNRGMSILERLEYKAIPFEKFITAVQKKGILGTIETVALIFNVICFLPFGVLLRFFTDKKWAIVGAGALFSLCVEVFQLFSCWGGPDLMDIMLNTLGTLIGVWMFDKIAPKLKSQTINQLAFWGSVAVSPFVLFAIINSIINFPQ